MNRYRLIKSFNFELDRCDHSELTAAFFCIRKNGTLEFYRDEDSYPFHAIASGEWREVTEIETNVGRDNVYNIDNYRKN